MIAYKYEKNNEYGAMDADKHNYHECGNFL